MNAPKDAPQEIVKFIDLSEEDKISAIDQMIELNKIENGERCFLPVCYYDPY